MDATAGTLTLPAAGNVLTGSGTYGNPSSAVTPTLTLPAAGTVLSSTTYGNPGCQVTGTRTDCPAAHALSGPCHRAQQKASAP